MAGPFLSTGEAKTRVGKKPRVLFTLSSIFPFDFFPDTIVIDEEKITIIYRRFFYERHVSSLYYYALMSASCETDLFFTTLNFELAMGMIDEEPEPISYLGKNQADYARRLITGMIRLHQSKDFDFQKLSVNQITDAAINAGDSVIT
jgi:hypothetical protein